MPHCNAGGGFSRAATGPKDLSDDKVFDATQYEFFGKDVEEDELGELEDVAHESLSKGIEDGGFLSFKKDKHEGIGSLSDIIDLTDAISQLNRLASEPRKAGDTNNRVSSPMKGLPLHHYFQRSSGIIKWFSNEKGFGFITPAVGSMDVFVHYSSLKSDGCVKLLSGEYVEFETVNGQNGKLQAINVTGRGGILLRNSINNKDGNIAGSITNNSRSIGPCFNCGDWGHLAKDCYHCGRSSTSSGSGSSYTEGQSGNFT